MIKELKNKIVKKVEDLDFERTGVYSFLNPYSYMQGRKYKECFLSLDGVMCDGKLFCYLLRLIGVKADRVSFDMTSLAPIVFSNLSSRGLTVYLIGSKETEIERAVSIYMREYPQLNIVGYRSGYFSNSDEREDTFFEIVEKKVDCVVVGMGTPNQELFLSDLKKKGWDGIGFTCGGFFHQTAKKGIRYYPWFFDYFNLRWLFRIIDEPQLIKRYFLQYPKSVILFFIDVFK